MNSPVWLCPMISIFSMRNDDPELIVLVLDPPSRIAATLDDEDELESPTTAVAS